MNRPLNQFLATETEFIVNFRINVYTVNKFSYGLPLHCLTDKYDNNKTKAKTDLNCIPGKLSMTTIKLKLRLTWIVYQASMTTIKLKLRLTWIWRTLLSSSASWTRRPVNSRAWTVYNMRNMLYSWSTPHSPIQRFLKVPLL